MYIYNGIVQLSKMKEENRNFLVKTVLTMIMKRYCTNVDKGYYSMQHRLLKIKEY